jgi:hypothetical protein
VEGRLSPAQQRVPQLPALFKPRHIRALGAKTDPAHPMDGYMVGDSVEPRRTALEEAMAEIEEDMLSKVKKDLTTYLDKLEKKVAVSRDLKDKAVDAVEKGKAEEEIEEIDGVSNPGDPGNDSIEPMQGYDPKTADGVSNPGDPGNDSIEPMQGYDPKNQPNDRIVDPMEEDELKAIRRLALGKKDLDELDYSAASGPTVQPSATQQAQTAGNAIKKYMPGATKFAANTVRQMKGQDPTKDPSYAKLSPAQQQQYVQAQKTIDATDADELEKFDANQAAANVQGIAKTVVNPANMPDVNLKSNVVDRKTAADYAPATISGKPATPPPDTPVATFEMDNGKSLGCYGDDNEGYELRHGEQTLPSRFRSLDDAGMAVKLYQARQRQQQPEQDLSQDYIEER